MFNFQAKIKVKDLGQPPHYKLEPRADSASLYATHKYQERSKTHFLEAHFKLVIVLRMKSFPSIVRFDHLYRFIIVLF